MNEIKCPKCGNVFSVDEADYASIANQIRNNEFNEELARRTAEQEKRFTIKQELELNKKELEFRKILEKKEQEISRLGTEVARNDSLRKMAVLETENSFREKLQAKDTEIAELKDYVDLAVALGWTAAAIVVTASASWAVMRYSDLLTRRLGPSGTLVLGKLMGFILICIGVQFVGSGIRTFMAGA